MHKAESKHSSWWWLLRRPTTRCTVHRMTATRAITHRTRRRLATFSGRLSLPTCTLVVGVVVVLLLVVFCCGVVVCFWGGFFLLVFLLFFGGCVCVCVCVCVCFFIVLYFCVILYYLFIYYLIFLLLIFYLECCYGYGAKENTHNFVLMVHSIAGRLLVVTGTFNSLLNFFAIFQLCQSVWFVILIIIIHKLK